MFRIDFDQQKGTKDTMGIGNNDTMANMWDAICTIRNKTFKFRNFEIRIWSFIFLIFWLGFLLIRDWHLQCFGSGMMVLYGSKVLLLQIKVAKDGHCRHCGGCAWTMHWSRLEIFGQFLAVFATGCTLVCRYAFGDIGKIAERTPLYYKIVE